MEAMFHMVDNGMGSTMYQRIHFPCLAKNMVLWFGKTTHFFELVIQWHYTQQPFPLPLP